MVIAKKHSTKLADFVLITGYSGAGKSTVMNAFEDTGYFCVDNLPPEMITSLAELFTHKGSKVERAAVVSDVRGGSYFEGMAGVLDQLDAAEVSYRVFFLEADERTLLNRYKETRRRHPLAPSGSVEEGIAAERALLEPLRERADQVIDTTDHSVAALRRRIARDILQTPQSHKLAVTFESFGFKHGPPRDADLMFDVRFLPNPHYEADLRPLTGQQESVVAYINADGALDEFEQHLNSMLDYLLPKYLLEGKSHLVVAIGCTGGRHRSVAIVERLAQRFSGGDEWIVDTAHRDIEKRSRT